MSLRLSKLSFAILVALTSIVACAVSKTDYSHYVSVMPSSSTSTALGSSTYSDFPVLVRLPSSASALLQSSGGTDLLVLDENETPLSFEVETFDPSGTTFVWVKVPTLSANTALTVYLGGSANSDNNPTAVWSKYVGVWHFSPSEAGGTTVADATGHDLGGTTSGTVSTYAGPFGGDTLQCTEKINAPDYDSLLSNVAQFSVSGWFKAPSYAGGTKKYHSFVSKKDNLTWSADKGWYIEMSESKTKANLVLTASNNFNIPDVSANWNYFHLVSDGSTVKVYINGSTTAAVSKSYKVKASGKVFLICGANGCSDEYRLRADAASADETALEYATMANAEFFDYGTVTSTDATAPTVGVPVVTRDASGAFLVSAEVSENVPASVAYDADGVSDAMATFDAELPMTYSATISGLASDTTYLCSVKATSTGGTVTEKSGMSAFYNGDLSVEKVSDAAENGAVPGVFRISRADTAHDLAVAYTVGGTAIAGQTYTALSGTATIPAGSLSADIEVVPLLDQDTTADTTVVLTLAAGLYGIDASAGSASLTITNLVAPAGFNTWISPSNSLASIDCNWSSGHSPTASENVLFDGRLSTADCTWDAAASATVASWTQTNDYTGVITLWTVYPGKGDFQCLTVKGPMAIHSGTITHPQSRTLGDIHNTSWDWLGDLLENETYRLRLDVGSLVVGANGAIDAKGKGYRVTHNSSTVNASHGARVSRAAQRCYGDPKKPIHIGLADKTQNNGSYYSGKGGGAIYVTSSGPIVVDGAIQADSDRNGTACCGAAGSVYLEAPSVTGTGRISAYGPNSGDGNYKGTGGRVAIVTDEPVDRSTFSAITADSARKSGARYGGAGTVFFKDRTRQNGLLVVGSSTDATTFEWDRIYATASVTTDGDWTFDEVEFGRFGFLVVPAGTKLTLPNGLASCTGVVTSASVMGGIRYEGGTLNIGSGSQTIAGNWMFCAWSNYVFQADVTVKDGAAIGVHPVTGVKDSDSNSDVSARKPPAFLSCRVVVRGDLTVAATGLLRAESCGVFKRDHNNPSQYLGVLGYGTHGGRHHAKGRGDYFCPTNFYYKGYDSVFSPSLPGCSGWYGNGSSDSGGAMSIAVSGHLSLDGVATACGSPATGRADQNNAGGAGGSIDITAGSISGTGTIIANGGSISSTQGGGGRIAIKLTSPGADFSHLVMTNVVASGRTYGNTASERTTSSAGTVYLQTAADGEKGGTVYIAMSAGNRLATNTNTTEMVSLGYGGDDVKDYKKVNYVISDYGRAAVNTNIVAASVKIADTNSFLDLEGNTLRIKSFMYPKVVNEETVIATLGSGKYTAAELVERGIECVLDSSEGKTGVLDVGGIGFMLYVR